MHGSLSEYGNENQHDVISDQSSSSYWYGQVIVNQWEKAWRNFWRIKAPGSRDNINTYLAAASFTRIVDRLPTCPILVVPPIITTFGLLIFFGVIDLIVDKYIGGGLFVIAGTWQVQLYVWKKTNQD